MHKLRSVLAGLTLSLLLGSYLVLAQAQINPQMSFFITSVGTGSGANLGGLLGADRHCQTLAATAGSTRRIWRAYLSTTELPQLTAIHARNRIGTGPWHNAKGVQIAANVDDLHGPKNNLNKQTALTEKGEVVNGRGDKPNRHDILTGSLADGTATKGGGDTTCRNWTSSTDGSALLGHHDREGGGEAGTSWNSAHPSKGCSQQNLQATGGDGFFYCFAND